MNRRLFLKMLCAAPAAVLLPKVAAPEPEVESAAALWEMNRQYYEDQNWLGSSEVLRRYMLEHQQLILDELAVRSRLHGDTTMKSLREPQVTINRLPGADYIARHGWPSS